MIQTRKQPPQRKTQILLVDDHPIARQGLAQLINQEPDLQVCADVENGAQAMNMIATHNPDLAIVDISLKEGSGLELVKAIKAQHDGLTMLVFSMHDETLCAERALEAGALGYVMKQEPTETIMVAIRRVLEGDIYLSEAMTHRLLRKPNAVEGDATTSAIRALSDREFEVFTLMGEGKRTIEIADILHISPKTIEAHRLHIRKKLGLKGWFEVTRHAIHWVNRGA